MSLPKDQRRSYEPDLRGRVSVADAIVLEHHLGRTAATRVTEIVDPWQLPGENARSSVGIKVCIKIAVSKVAKAGRHFSELTEDSIAAHLLSPLLVNKWAGRPLSQSLDPVR